MEVVSQEERGEELLTRDTTTTHQNLAHAFTLNATRHRILKHVCRPCGRHTRAIKSSPATAPPSWIVYTPIGSVDGFVANLEKHTWAADTRCQNSSKPRSAASPLIVTEATLADA